MKKESKLEDDLMDVVNGGKLYDDVYSNVDSYMHIYKNGGQSPADLKNKFKEIWNTHGWQWSTNSSQDDLKAILNYIDQHTDFLGGWKL